MISYGFALDLIRHSAGRFAEIMRLVSGDGVCRWGGEFGLALEGMQITLSSGTARAAGYWLLSDEPETLTFPPALNTRDRQDAVAVYVSYPERRAYLQIMEDIEPEAIRDGMVEEPDGCGLILYTARIRRGATSLKTENITDRRQYIPELAALSEDGLRVYEFLQTGMDQWIEDILSQSRQEQQRADEAADELDKLISSSGKGPGIGEVTISLSQPVPAGQWLPCDGGAVPAEYMELRALLGGYLPRVVPEDDRFKAYIYGGKPLSREDMHVRYVPIGSSGYMTEDSKIYYVMR